MDMSQGGAVEDGGPGYPRRAHDMFVLLEKNGWKKDRITGSHHIFQKPGRRCIPVAVHRSEVAPGLRRLILKQAGLSGRGLADEASSDPDVSALSLTSDSQSPSSSGRESLRRATKNEDYSAGSSSILRPRDETEANPPGGGDHHRCALPCSNLFSAALFLKRL